MDKDIESRLREKYALIDKSDPDQIAEAQKAGLNINEDLLGDLDGTNFGIGLAGKDSKASKADLLKVTNKKRSKVILNKAP